MDRVRVAVEGRVDRAIPRAKRFGTVDVQRRALDGGNLRERHAVAHEFGWRAVEADRSCRCWHVIGYSTQSFMLPDSPDAVEALIKRCLNGDQIAWEQIVRQYWRKVFNVAYKFVGKHDEAEDLTQD